MGRSMASWYTVGDTGSSPGVDIQSRRRRKHGYLSKRLNKARRTYRHPKPDQGSTKVSTLTDFFFGGGGEGVLYSFTFPL